MSINDNALKNFENSNFNFVNNGKDVDYSNLIDSNDYSLRLNKTVVQDNMSKQNIINTINNEWGAEVNV